MTVSAPTPMDYSNPSKLLRSLLIALALSEASCFHHRANAPPDLVARTAPGRYAAPGATGHVGRGGYRVSSSVAAPDHRAPGGSSTTTTALSVWWFGGSESGEPSSDSDESCELVAVRIDRTSPNSRRIGGEITVDRPIDDIWAILTDYDNLSTHVPNLVESRRVDAGGRGSSAAAGGGGGEQGDGSYTCRLFQKGSQKIIGFNFAASVTMDMTEEIVSTMMTATNIGGDELASFDESFENEAEYQHEEERRILFKCVDSQFFTEFDGEWRVRQSPRPDPYTGLPITTVSYVVDVRPKGPVPVAALEWRIREDVPTNLRAVKRAAMEVGYEGVMTARGVSSGARRSSEATRSSMPEEPSLREVALVAAPTAVKSQLSSRGKAAVRTGRKLADKAANAVSMAAATASQVAAQKAKAKLAPVRVSWYEDETMAAYLDD